MTGLIIGLGSIAKKHINACSMSNYDVNWLALRHKKSSNEIADVKNIYSLNEKNNFDFVLISNPTSLHFETIKDVLKFKKPLFIEKPIVRSLTNINFLQNETVKRNVPVYVACNLRFHPVIRWLYDAYKGKTEFSKIEEVNVYCGSYLPDWRPGQNFRNLYSSQKKMGGGVHLDLIHELDYLYWIFGKPESSIASFRNTSHLEIDAVDSALYWLDYQSFIANVSLNYYRKDTKRSIEILTESDTYLIDLKTCKVKKNEKIIFEIKDYSVQDTYLMQIEYFLKTITEKKYPFFNTFDDGINILRIALSKNVWKD